MSKAIPIILLFALSACATDEAPRVSHAMEQQLAEHIRPFPAPNASNINPDTHLVLTFTAPPTIGASGLIRIYDAADDSLVDTLDMSIPPSPRPTDRASPANPNDKTVYQIKWTADRHVAAALDCEGSIQTQRQVDNCGLQQSRVCARVEARPPIAVDAFTSKGMDAR